MRHHLLRTGTVLCVLTALLGGCDEYNTGASSGVMVRQFLKEEPGKRNDDIQKARGWFLQATPLEQVAALTSIMGDVAYYISPFDLKTIISSEALFEQTLEPLMSATTEDDLNAGFGAMGLKLMAAEPDVMQRIVNIKERVGKDYSMMAMPDIYTLIWDDKSYNSFLYDDDFAKKFVIDSYEHLPDAQQSSQQSFDSAERLFQSGPTLFPIPARNGS
jgi:hypothetical protein